MSAIKFQDPFSARRPAKTWNGGNAETSAPPRSPRSSQQWNWQKGTSVLMGPIKALTRSHIGIQRQLSQPLQFNGESLSIANPESSNNCHRSSRKSFTTPPSLIEETDWIEVVARAFTFSDIDGDSNEPSAEETVQFYSRDSVITIPLDDFLSERRSSSISGVDLTALPLSRNASLVMQGEAPRRHLASTKTDRMDRAQAAEDDASKPRRRRRQ